MKKKVIWLVLSGGMVLTLLLSACAPAVVEKEKKAAPKEVVTPKEEVVTPKEEAVAKEVVVPKEEERFVKWTGKKLDGTVVEKMIEKPKYGGIVTFVKLEDPARGWSRTTHFFRGHTWAYFMTNDALYQHDRWRGPAGTGEYSGLYNVELPVDLLAGGLAESWEIQPDTITLKIRKGIYWHDKAPTYGAQLTAEDVVYSYVLGYSAKSTWPTAYPYISNLKNPAESIYVDPDDPWSVVFKTDPQFAALLWERLGTQVIMPQVLGDPDGTGPDTWDWKTISGTGPFIMKDFIAASSLTYRRNPNYWDHDPFFPENQLPYVDGVKVFIIPDRSTQQAALRTGKIDVLAEIIDEEWESLMRSNPELKWQPSWLEGWALQMRHDVKPFDDVRVRRALAMAIDQDSIVKDYYRGKAEKFYWPPFPIPEHQRMYVPIEQMPQSVQELYEYHPDKAKQLLAEAGYPNGFKTSIVLNSAQQEWIDLSTIVANHWAKVGVDLELQLKAPAVFASMARQNTHEQGMWATVFMTAPIKFTEARVDSQNNHAMM
ncbi:MAG: hypothetical protein HYY80_00150, partial [Chloroflexi bacterium]|nr:hypothetical protein [Chloroflexota bacterium]